MSDYPNNGLVYRMQQRNGVGRGIARKRTMQTGMVDDSPRVQDVAKADQGALNAFMGLAFNGLCTWRTLPAWNSGDSYKSCRARTGVIETAYTLEPSYWLHNHRS